MKLIIKKIISMGFMKSFNELEITWQKIAKIWWR
jgi:hypothetical protein